MYPYFQKKQEPSLNSRETTLADPLRSFFLQNPAFGKLLFQVTGGRGAFPVSDATVVLSRAISDKHTFSVTTSTDESGKTDEISLPAPDKSLSQSPGGENVFAVYEALISAVGMNTVLVHDIPVFDGITTIQPVDLSLDLNSERQEQTESVTDTEPNL